MKKVLLLGGTGQLGREWQRYRHRHKKEQWQCNAYSSSQLDITHLDSVRRTLEKQGPDLIINCAAYTDVDGAEEHCRQARRVNAEAVANLAELSAVLDIKLVHFSTDYVFAGRKHDRERFPLGYREDHTADPVNCYGQTKWEGEQAIRRSGCRHLIVRVSWLCGAYGSNFVKTMLRLGREMGALRVVDDQFGSPTFTHNLVPNTQLLIDKKQEGTYHLSSSGIISWADFAEAIFELTGLQVDVERVPTSEYPTPAPRPRFSKLNTAKARQVEGIRVEHWKTGLRQLLEQLTTNEQG